MYKWLFIALMTGAVYFYIAVTNQYKNTDDILPAVTGVPLQTPLEKDARAIHCKAKGYDWEITPVFNYDVTALVFGVSHNMLSQAKGVVPTDLGLLWADNARYKYYKNVTLRVRLNHYTARWKNGVIFNLQAAANTHCATCSAATAAKLRSIVPGDQVRLKGQLINAVITKGGGRPATWNTSVTREDTREGSCELLFIISPDDIQILRPATRFNYYMFLFCLWGLPIMAVVWFAHQYLLATLAVREMRRMN